jgi:anti-sigma regulatory factor (Ser/Thr protein kinase)
MALVASLNLAIEEAATNVVLYAYQEGTGLIDIDALVTPHYLQFVITDNGVPFDPTQQEDADITLSAEERPIGGLGIFLVRQIMDSVKYERVDNKNVLTLRKSLTSCDT